MRLRKRWIVATGLVAAGVLGAGGMSLAAARDDDAPLTGETREKAEAAALEHVGEGTVTETELGDDGATYGVEILKQDGSQVEVNLDDTFAVIGTEADDDRAEDDD